MSWLIIILVTVIGYLFVNYVAKNLWSKKRLNNFLSNPITALISSVYLILLISKFINWNFTGLLSDRFFGYILLLFIFLISVPFYSFYNFFKKPKKDDWTTKEFTYQGVKILLLADLISTIVFIVKYII